MFDLSSVEKKVKSELGDTSDWCDEQYDTYFASYLGDINTLYKTLNEDKSKISDDELETVLTYLPLQIIEVSEVLSNYKFNNECLKLHIKKLESQLVLNSDAKTVAEKKEKASLEVIDYKILSIAYSSVISRVENEIDFAREFIMTAKKLWDSRMKTYSANPVSENIDQLGVYTEEED